MASWTSGVLRTCIFTAVLVFLVAFGEGSVTWRRVRKPTLRTTSPVTASSVPSLKKSSVTWRRSIMTRRSTVAVEHSHEQNVANDKRLESSENGSDDIEEASSVHEEHVVDEKPENDSEVKPLAPGTRPGFWFDSRRKKTSDLMKPGVRRNSLFPTRSTSTTRAPTTEAVTPLTVIPRTLPSITASSNIITRDKQFGLLNRSTRPPITFRKRLKTTRIPKPSTVQEPSRINKDESYDNKETDVEEVPSNNKTTKEINGAKYNLEEDTDRVSPLSRFGKRPYNGTRLSWIRTNSKTTTTAVPSRKTTVPPKKVSIEQDNETFTRKTTKPVERLSNFRSRTRSTTTLKPTSRTSPQPQRIEVSTKAVEVEEEEESFGKKYSKSRDDASKPPIRNHYTKSDDYVDDNFEAEIFNNNREINENERTKPTPPKTKPKTTVEPFYITREYGSVVTAVADVKERPSPAVRTDSETRKKKKRIRPKTTAAPTTTTTKLEESFTEIDYDNDDSAEEIDFSNDVEDFSSSYPSINRTTPLHFEKLEEIKEDVFSTRISITPSPVTPPALSTIGLDGDAYVVWSLGQGGSGWSYQKHGGEVKWSAQNSGAVGDRWSVVGKDEAANIEADLNQPWPASRNGTGDRKSENIVLKDSEKPAQPSKAKNAPRPLAYEEYKNDTLLRVDGNPESELNTSTPKFPPTMRYSTSVSVGGIKYLDPANEMNSTYQHSVPAEGTSYPHPNYSYISDQRDIPEITPTHLAYQEHAAQGQNEENRQTFQHPAPGQQLNQLQTTNPYSTEPPQTETIPTYVPNDPTYSEQYSSVPAVSDPLQGYLSNIPPELARAVVDDKKWHVVGGGGDDGWSLLNEDGIMEWKIHNVDGKWKVTSAEQLEKLFSPQENAYVDGEKVQEKQEVEVQEYNTAVKQSPPKIWRFDDDYAKWRAVSAESGDPEAQSLSEKLISSEEYDYESEDYDSFGPSDDYYNFPPGGNYKEDHVSRPAYTIVENKNVQNAYEGQNYPYLLGNIEVANSKEDAIESWKTLLSQEGYLISETPAPKVEPRQDYLQNSNKNRERTISTRPPVIDKVNKNQLSRYDERVITEKRKRDDDEQPRNPSRIQQFSKHDGSPKRPSQVFTHNLSPREEKKITKSEPNSHEEVYAKDKYRKNNEKDDSLTASRLRIRHQDHPKLDSLINKLETIQKQANGRAVVDLAKLLRQIKGQMNDTDKAFITPHSNSLLQAKNSTPDFQVENFKQMNNPESTRRQHSTHRTTTTNRQHVPNEFVLNSHHNVRPTNENKQQNIRISNDPSGYIRPRERPAGTMSYRSKGDRGPGNEMYAINSQLRTQLPPGFVEYYTQAQAVGGGQISEIPGLTNLQDIFEYPTESSQQEGINVPLKDVKDEHYTTSDDIISPARQENLLKLHQILVKQSERVTEQNKLLNEKQKPEEQNYLIFDNKYGVIRDQSEPKQRPTINGNHYEVKENQHELKQRHGTSENQYEVLREREEQKHRQRISYNQYELKREQLEPRQRHKTSENKYELIRGQEEPKQRQRINYKQYGLSGEEQEPQQRQRTIANKHEPIREHKELNQRPRINQYELGEKQNEPQKTSEDKHERTREQQEPKHRPRIDGNKFGLIEQQEPNQRPRFNQYEGEQHDQLQRHRTISNKYDLTREQQELKHRLRVDGNNFELIGEQQGPHQRPRIEQEEGEQLGQLQIHRTTANKHELTREQQEQKHRPTVYDSNFELIGEQEPNRRPTINQYEGEQHEQLQRHRTTAKKYELTREKQESNNYKNPESTYQSPIRHQEIRVSHNFPTPTKKGDDGESTNSDEIYVNLRDRNQRKNHRRTEKRKPRRRKPKRKPKQSTPIVLKGETEVEDENGGSARNRKIIVIDYAGAEKRQSSVDKKELELIIRNVRHRRSGAPDEQDEKGQ